MPKYYLNDKEVEWEEIVKAFDESEKFIRFENFMSQLAFYLIIFFGVIAIVSVTAMIISLSLQLFHTILQLF